VCAPGTLAALSFFRADDDVSWMRTPRPAKSTASPKPELLLQRTCAQGSKGTYLLSTGENKIRICRGAIVNFGGLVITSSSTMNPFADGA